MMLITGTLLVLLSAVSPILVAYLTKASWSSKTKQAVALLVTVAIAAIVAFVPALGGTAVIVLGSGVGPFAESLVAAVGVIFAIQQVVFNFIFKDTEFATTLLDEKGVTDSLPEGVDTDGDGLEPDSDGGLAADEITESSEEEGIDPAELGETEGN